MTHVAAIFDYKNHIPTSFDDGDDFDDGNDDDENGDYYLMMLLHLKSHLLHWNVVTLMLLQMK